jgi:molybdate transport system substrate-binding protein
MMLRGQTLWGGSFFDIDSRKSVRQHRRSAQLGVAAMLAVALLGMKPAAAADVRVFTSGAPSEVEKVIAGTFSGTTGHRILLTVSTLGEIQKRSSAEHPDIVILPTPALDTLDKAGSLRPGSRIELARVGVGVVVREGAPLPDISTVDALRKTLLAAKSVVHPDPAGGGIAGAQIVRMFQRLGIADAMKPKETLMFALTGGVARVGAGESDIGLFNISEILPVKGVTLVGPLPAEVQSYITFSAAIHAEAAAPEPAAAFLQSLTAPNVRETWKAGGFEALGAAR